jgi:diadenosine tetraphosphatase ApaH/serine/threonine PP2A family protein phosphatase
VSALVGHTHVPGFFLEDRDLDEAPSSSRSRVEANIEWVGLPPDVVSWTPGEDEMPRGMRFILNPGSVGQPRDRDSRASYAILETATGAGADASADRFTFHRVEYDIARTQKKLHDLRAAGADLDPWLAERLELGQ